MEGILARKQTNVSEEPRHLTPTYSRRSRGTGTTDSADAIVSPLSPVAFMFRSYTPWSIQANCSERSCSQPISSNGTKLKGSLPQIRDKKCPNNPWKIVSAPSSYVYSYCEGNFTNGRGCTRTPYYLYFFQQQQLARLNVSEPSRSSNSPEIKAQTKNHLQPSNELTVTQSWIWSNHPQHEENKKRKSFANLMRSPYLRAQERSATPYSSRKLQSSHKCQAWLKSSK